MTNYTKLTPEEMVRRATEQVLTLEKQVADLSSAVRHWQSENMKLQDELQRIQGRYGVLEEELKERLNYLDVFKDIGAELNNIAAILHQRL